MSSIRDQQESLAKLHFDMESRQILGRVQAGCMENNPMSLKYLRQHRLNLMWTRLLRNHLVCLVLCLHTLHSQLDTQWQPIAISIKLQALLGQEHLAL